MYESNSYENNTYENTPKKNRRDIKVVLAMLLVSVIAIGALVVYGRGPMRAETATNVLNAKGSAATVEEEETKEAEEPAQEEQTRKSTGVTTVVTDVTEVVEKAMPSIVSVYNNYTQDINWFGMTYTQEGQAAGSGIILEKDGEELLIVTNNHVVDGEDSLEVQFIDDETAAATLKGTDPDNDLAVISVKLKDLSASTQAAISVAEIGDSDNLKIGEPAIAIGNALGYGQSVTAGVISALNREIPTEDGNSNSYIQTDAAINQGNSGGALLNINGEVVGINSNKLGGMTIEGMGFAIPISKAMPIIEDLMAMETRDLVDEKDRGALGINGVSVTQDISKAYNMPKGAYIVEIIEGSAADESELKKGDIITAVDKIKVSTMEDLKKRLTYYKAGEEITLTVNRADDGEYVEKEITLTLGNREILGDYEEENAEENAEEQTAEPKEENPVQEAPSTEGWEGKLFEYFPFPFNF